MSNQRAIKFHPKPPSIFAEWNTRIYLKRRLKAARIEIANLRRLLRGSKVGKA